MKKFTHNVKRIFVRMFGSAIVDGLYWKFRHLILADKSWGHSYISPLSLAHPHRTLLVQRVSQYVPFSTLLEIGCASGPNLYLLAKRFPAVYYYGIDISAHAISVGEKWFQDQHMSNVSLSVSKAGDLEKFKDKSIDIVITDAVLIYIGPEYIASVLRELVRVARKAIILVEQHDSTTNSFYHDRWIHNYKKLFSPYVQEERIRLTKIQEQVLGGDWARFGYVIEVKLETL